MTGYVHTVLEFGKRYKKIFETFSTEISPSSDPSPKISKFCSQNNKNIENNNNNNNNNNDNKNYNNNNNSNNNNNDNNNNNNNCCYQNKKEFDYGRNVYLLYKMKLIEIEKVSMRYCKKQYQEVRKEETNYVFFDTLIVYALF